MTPTPRPRRLCAECGKVIRRRKVAMRVSVTTLSGGIPMRDTYTGPLCSIACGAVAAVKALEQVRR